MKAKTALPCILIFYFTFFSTFVAGAAFDPGVLRGAYDELLPSIVRGKPLVFSGKTRWEYDDNIYTDEYDKVASWKLLIEPKVDYHMVREASYLGFYYQLSYRWFENREEDPEDVSHDISVTLNHMFSNTFELRLRDVYRRREDQITVAEQIEVVGEGGTVEEVSRPRDRDESYDRNDFSASGILQLSNRLNFIGSFTHLWLDYEDENLSINNDRIEYSAGGRFELIWRPETSMSLGYDYRNVDYDEEINKVDSETDKYYAGINHRFSPALTGGVDVGWQKRIFDSYIYETDEGEEVIVEEKEQESPYVNLSISAPLSETLVTSMGYRYDISETDQSIFLSEETQTIYLSVTNKFTERFSLRFNGIMAFGDYDVDQARYEENPPEDFSEDTVQFALVFRYKIKQGWFAETGWRYIDVDSDFPGRTYERNRTFVGLNAVF